MDGRQPCKTPSPTVNQSVVPFQVLTVASWPAYRFLRRQIRWSEIPISLRIFQLVVIHTVKGLSIVNEAEVDFSGIPLLSLWSNECWQFGLRVLCLFNLLLLLFFLNCILCFYLFIYFPFIFISWRLITLQYCSGFCHTLTWIIF